MASKKKNKTRDVAPKSTRPRLTSAHKATMLAVLLRNERLFVQAADRLTAQHLADAMPESAAFAVLWRLASEFFATTGRLPQRRVIESRLETLLQDYPEALTDDEISDVEKFLAEAFGGDLDPDEQSIAIWAEGCLRQMLTELVADRAAALLRGGTDSVAADLPAILDALSAEAHGVETIGTAGLGGLVFGEGWEDEKMAIARPTQVDILDAFTDGEVPGEVVIIAGPYGSCKSLLAVHSCICAALEYQRQWRRHAKSKSSRTGGATCKRQMAVYVSYEMPKHEFRRRVLANAARVPYGRLMSVSSLDKLRGDGEALLDYEHKLFEVKLATGQPVPSERERVRSAIALINDHVMFVDMTGKNRDLEHFGSGGAQELSRVMQSLFRDGGDSWPGVLWVDHTAEMADEYAQAAGIDDHDKILMLRMLPKNLAKIGTHFGVTVYQIHQLSGAANERGATARLSKTDMEGCRSLGRSADFVLLINKPTNDGRAIMVCDKHRRSKPDRPERVILINGAYMSVGLDDTHVIESSSRLILPASMAHEIARPQSGKSDSSLLLEEVLG